MIIIFKIQVYLDEVSKQYSNIAEVIHIGTTYENNLIKGVKVYILNCIDNI